MNSFELLVQAHRPGMKATLARLVAVLRAHDVRYVIGGANALSLYVRPRMTIDIDAFVDPQRKDELERLLAGCFQVVSLGRFHSKFKDGDVEVDILYAGADAEDFALAHPREAVILGTTLKAASPEALLWLYLLSEKEQNYVDAIELVRANPNLDLSRIRADARASARLDKVLGTAAQPASSYEASRARRS
jgi:hypothetical protein